MGGRIRGPEVVNRIHDASPEEIAPHAIDGLFREIGLRGHPFGQCRSRVRSILLRQDPAVHKTRLYLLLGARIDCLYEGQGVAVLTPILFLAVRVIVDSQLRA